MLALLQRPYEHHQRGSISVLSLVWIAFTLLGVVTISHATEVLQLRARAQESADSISLAAAVEGEAAAHRLEHLLDATITHLSFNNGVATVDIIQGSYAATSSASAGP